MIPGSDYIFECPKCSNLISRGSLISGNTFGAKRYSDGQEVAPMLPDFPNLTQCKKCNEIFWLDKLTSIGSCDGNKTDNPEWVNADQAEFLGIKELFRALECRVYENTEEEILIRQAIWWAYNDRVRGNGQQKIFENDQDEILWETNLRSLLRILNKTSPYHIITAAEIQRNLGDFEGCVSMLQSVIGKDFNWIKDILIEECKRKNSMVVELV